MGILTRLFSGLGRRATPENPSFNLNDPAAWDALGASPSASCVSVTPLTALTYSPWWRGINLLSRDVAKVPLFVYQRTGEGKERATRHPAYQLLRYKPNNFQTAMTFRSTMQSHALSRGNAYAYIYRRGDGTPAEIVPLSPDCTYPVRENGRLWYVTEVNASAASTTVKEMRRLAPQNILHIKGLSDDGLMGLSVYDLARESLGLGMGANRYATIFFRNAARPAIVLEHPARLDEKAKVTLRDSWERMQTGLENAHRTAVLDNGLKAHTISHSAEDSQLLETRTFQTREVANWIGVPPHKLGDTTRTSFSSLEQENQSYLDESLDPWFCVWEHECRDKLLSEDEKETDSHVVEFVREALARADMAARSAYYRTSLGGRPWMTMNEVRSRENLNPLEGGDVVLEPLNMAGADDVKADGEDSEEGGE